MIAAPVTVLHHSAVVGIQRQILEDATSIIIITLLLLESSASWTDTWSVMVIMTALSLASYTSSTNAATATITITIASLCRQLCWHRYHHHHHHHKGGLRKTANNGCIVAVLLLCPAIVRRIGVHHDMTAVVAAAAVPLLPLRPTRDGDPRPGDSAEKH